MTLSLTGKKAPPIKLKDSYNDPVSLNDFGGKWIVLYFYPKDNTSGCTTEAMDFTALKNDFDALNTVILGISPDSCESHQKFVVKYDLGIKLLSDPDKKVLEKYGVWQLKKMYGREYYGVVRSTFLIDPKGKVVFAWEKVKVKEHASAVLEKVRELSE